MIFITLLRGINVSGKHKIIMKDFVNLLAEQPKITKVKSYIQSGNFIVDTHIKSSKELSDVFIAIIFKNYKYNVSAISYTLDEFTTIVNDYPFKAEEKRDYFTFLSETPDANKANEFIKKTNTFDEFKIDKNMIYVKYATKYSDSKLNNNLFEKQLQVTATTRNLNTVTKLIDIAKEF